MPTYEYFCKKCEYRFEAFKSISARKEPESEACPKCGELEVSQGHFTPNLMGDALRMGVSGHHTPDGFRDVLRSIKDRNPGSNIEIK